MGYDLSWMTWIPYIGVLFGIVVMFYFASIRMVAVEGEWNPNGRGVVIGLINAAGGGLFNIWLVILMIEGAMN